MVLLKIFKLDDESNAIATLNDGQHELGRGPLLECTDQRVSRKQAVLDVSQEEATVTPVHIRPCFFISANSTTVTILPKNKPVKLKNGDKFGLMPDQYWYKFTIEENGYEHKAVVSSKNNTESTAVDESSSRSEKETILHSTVHTYFSTLPPWLNGIGEGNNERLQISNEPSISNCKRKIESDRVPSPKIQRLLDSLEDIVKRNRDNENTEETDEVNNADKLQTNEEVPPVVKQELSDSDDDAEKVVRSNRDNDVDKIQTSEMKIEEVPPVFKRELSDSDDDAVNDSGKKESENKQNLDEAAAVKNSGEKASGSSQNHDEAASSSSADRKEAKPKPKLRRDRCWYGESCYRKNPLHRKEYSHPNDSDYESDPDDNRPLCPYGTNCYRRNKDHRREYRHTDTNAASPKPNAKKPPKKKNQKPADTAMAKRQKKTYYESPEDDYDLEDPFIDDGSEDEYVEENDSDSDYSDSEMNDSEKLEEDETKRLLKEAKRFTRGGKQS